MSEAQVNIAIRWFMGYGLHCRIIRVSTHICQREERFQQNLRAGAEACLWAKIATADVCTLMPR